MNSWSKVIIVNKKSKRSRIFCDCLQGFSQKMHLLAK